MVIFIVLGCVGCANISTDRNELVCHLEEIEKRKTECVAKNLSPELKQVYTSAMKEGIEKILSNYNPPKYDGGKYSGEINFCLNANGGIDSAMLYKASGHRGLDVAMMKAIKKTKDIIAVPDNECLANSFYFNQLKLYYDQNDMQL